MDLVENRQYLNYDPVIVGSVFSVRLDCFGALLGCDRRGVSLLVWCPCVAEVQTSLICEFCSPTVVMLMLMNSPLDWYYSGYPCWFSYFFSLES